MKRIGKRIFERISVQELRARLSRLLDRVADGETLTITRHGSPVARLVPVDRQDEQAEQKRREWAAQRRRKKAEEAYRGLRELGKQIRGVSREELIASIHERRKW